MNHNCTLGHTQYRSGKMSFNLEEKIHKQSSLNHPKYPELVNNYVLYHRLMDPSKAKLWESLPPLYENYESISSIFQDIIDNPEGFYRNGSITATVPVSQLWTCDASLHFSEHADADLVSKENLSAIMGYDRLNKYTEIKQKAPKFMKLKKGFSKTSDTLHAMVRWIYDDNDNIIDFVLVKDRGNLRSHMALASNGGDDISVLVAIDFHKPGITNTKMLKDEAENFVEDAKDRRGHDPVTSFRSGYLAERIQFICQKQFFEDVLQVDFGGVINAERKKLKKPALEFDLSSTQYLDFNKDTGHPQGYITKYGQENLVCAVETLKEIMTVRKESTRITTSAIHTVAKTFFYLTELPAKIGIKSTEDGKKVPTAALSDKETIKEALVWMYTRTTENRHNSNDHTFDRMLKELTVTDNDKDTTWIGFKTYIPALLDDIRQGKGNTNRILSTNVIVQRYIREIVEHHLQIQAAQKVDSFKT